MLTEIKLTNFKCFKEETSIPLSRFNLFTGANGAGKSSALQALLLMRQSVEHNPYTTELILNGSCVNLGSFDDVRNRDISREKPILFEITANYKDDKFLVRYHLKPITDEISLSIFKIDMILYDYIEDIKDYRTVNSTVIYDEETDLYCEQSEDVYKNGVRFKITRPFVADVMCTIKEATNSLNLNFNIDNIHFISADRMGPQEFYQKAMLSNFYHVGTRGEFTINLLDRIGNELEVDESLYLKENPRVLGENPITLKSQTEAWVGKILNPLSLDANPLGKSNFLELLIGGFKPSNVGFGYSSILPIIVTGLIAKPGEKIVIENPEIHLHPKAQSALIEFLIKVSNTGVQIFVESHSDHVLNALRIATKKNLLKPEENLLKPEDSSVLFFSQNQETKANEITSILIDEKGKLHKKTQYGTVAKIPKGFFDEWTNSMAKLFGYQLKAGQSRSASFACQQAKLALQQRERPVLSW